jgi:HAD superfamily hydrolase (TIGR01509 family)
MTTPMRHPSTIARAESIRAVAFDLDGTLINTLPAMEASWNYVVAPMIGRAITREEIVSRLGPRAVEIMRTYVETDAEAIVETLSDHFSTSTETYAELYPGVENLIEMLAARGLKLAVVTSMRRRNAIPLLRQFGLLDAFSEVVTEDDVTRLKPDAEPVLRAVRALELEPADMLFVGDNPTDMLASRAAGTVGGAAVWGFYGRKAAPDADLVLEQPADVLRVVE